MKSTITWAGAGGPARQALPGEKADAFRRISLTVLSSLFSRCSSFNCSRSAELKDSDSVLALSRFLIQECSVCAEQPIFLDMDSVAGRDAVN